MAIDYDPGATKINQENRIKLMLANAKGLTCLLYTSDKILMEVSIGKGGAVGGNQQVRAVKVGRRKGSQLDLDRPLAQLG